MKNGFILGVLFLVLDSVIVYVSFFLEKESGKNAEYAFLSLQHVRNSFSSFSVKPLLILPYFVSLLRLNFFLRI